MSGHVGPSVRQRTIALSLRVFTGMLCKVDATELQRLPESGPLIVIANHVNFLEIPILFSRLFPRPVAGFAKAETWENPLLGFLFDTFGAIPLRRGELDLAAFRQAMAALEQGKILAVAPEGTRSGNGQLGQGRAGAVMLALRSGTPILPLVYYGAEDYRRDWLRLRRPEFHVVVGQPFRLRHKGKLTPADRHSMGREIMYQLAALLPERYRGAYADLDSATDDWLELDRKSVV